MPKFYYRCPKCRNYVKESSKYCDQCGVKLPEKKYSIGKPLNYTIKPDNSVWDFFNEYGNFISTKAVFINNAMKYCIPYWKKQFIQKSNQINEV